MALHKELCQGNLTEACSMMIHKQAEIDYEVTSKCVQDSFVENTGNDYRTALDNKYLWEDFVYGMRAGVRFLPEIMINRVVYKGQLDPDTVFDALCASF